MRRDATKPALMTLMTLLGKPALTDVIVLPGNYFSVWCKNSFLRSCCNFLNNMMDEEIEVSIWLFMIVVL